MVVFQGLMPLVSLYLIKLVIEAVTTGMTEPDKKAAFIRITVLIVAVGGVNVLSNLLTSLAGYIQERQSLLVTDYVFTKIHEKSVQVDLEYYENPKYYDSLHLAQQESPGRPTQVLNNIVQMIQNCITLFAMIGLLITFHWAIASALLLAVLPGLFVRLRFSHKLFDLQKKRAKLERRAYYFNWLLTGDYHAKELRLYNLGKMFITQFSRLRKEIRKEKLSLHKKRMFAELGAQSATIVVIFSMFGFIAWRTVIGLITVGDLVMYYQAFQRGQTAFRSVLTSIAGLYEDSLFLNNLFEFLDLQPKVRRPINPVAFPVPINRGIQFENVAFRYPDSPRHVLDNISFELLPGEHIALVGENGSGKTTLVKLLCRLYDPLQGAIRFDGIPAWDFELEDLRAQFSVIFQDFSRYHLTASDNIRLGNTAIKTHDRKIQYAAEQSGADKVIEKLPHGYDTFLGKWFEEGEELSIGEWQKIALARAFIRDSQFILLDEPTSALDAKAEYKIFQQFRKLAAGKTTVFISHRMASARIADRILVLDNGTISEQGSHDQLMKQDGVYARMFRLQAEHYI
ncbi:ABC transporter ATP-binding protein [candidate division KSB1 bacterium]|nr:ABC transporter ATP-binding protein [candidate division KSB1 bacterium]